MADIGNDVLEQLKNLDTPTVCNALEVVAPERRGFGYTTQPLVCTRPELGVMVGYARTATIQARFRGNAQGGVDRGVGQSYYQYIDDGPKPSIAIIQDLDGDSRGYGSLWGEVNSNIHFGLGCLGVITDGSVRDIPDVASGFQMLADRVGPSHAFVRVCTYGGTVSVAGMDVTDGDIVHADQHGAVVIPANVASEVAGAADLIARRERVVINAAQQEGFNMSKLREAWGDQAEIH